MIETFVFGTPKGFDFYEADTNWNSYFRSFYVSARRDRRLMVNRRADGKTVYSYLCYNTCEVADGSGAGRPHGFFGCSIVVDGNMYCADLPELLDWFETLFKRLLSRGKLICVNSAGVVEYQCRKFNEQSDEVQWLKSQLPKIFNTGTLKLCPYDASFVEQDDARTLRCNSNISKDRLLTYLKQCTWLAISPSFEESREINIYELRVYLERYKSEALRSSVETSVERRRALLGRIYNSCVALKKSVDDSIPSLLDSDERQTYTELSNDYGELLLIVRELYNKTVEYAVDNRVVTINLPQQNTDNRGNNGGNSGNNGGNNNNDNSDRQPGSDEKRCVQCSNIYKKVNFPQGGPVCAYCLAKKQRNRPKRPRKKLFDKITPKVLLLGALSVAFIIGIFSWCSSTGAKLDESKFAEYIRRTQYDSAWVYSNQFPSFAKVKQEEIKKAMQKDIDSILCLDDPGVNITRELIGYFNRHGAYVDSAEIKRYTISTQAENIDKTKSAIKNNNATIPDPSLSRQSVPSTYWNEKITNANTFRNNLNVGNYIQAWHVACDDTPGLKEIRRGLLKTMVENKLDGLLTSHSTNPVYDGVNSFLDASIIDTLGIEKNRYLAIATAVDNYRRTGTDRDFQKIDSEYRIYWKSANKKEVTDINKHQQATENRSAPKPAAAIAIITIKEVDKDHPDRVLHSFGPFSNDTTLTIKRSKILTIISTQKITFTGKVKPNEISDYQKRVKVEGKFCIKTGNITITIDEDGYL